MHIRFILLLFPLLFTACSSAQRKPDCVQSKSSSEVKCEQKKISKDHQVNRGYRERP